MEAPPQLAVPDALSRQNNCLLPSLTPEVINELRAQGWYRIGIMAAFVDSSGRVMMLEHRGRDKNPDGVLGPLGETTRSSGAIIEQPLETLFRGITEELGVQSPGSLDIHLHPKDGWVINSWPAGDNSPGQLSCAISFPVLLPDRVKTSLLTPLCNTAEVRRVRFMTPEEIFNTPDGGLRPGVKPWLQQLDTARLLNPAEFGTLIKLCPVGDYSPSWGEDLCVNS